MGANDLRSFLRQGGGPLAYVSHAVDDLPRVPQASRHRLGALTMPGADVIEVFSAGSLGPGFI